MSTAHLARCTVKGCGHVRRVEVEASGTTSDRFGNVRKVTTTPDSMRAAQSAPCPDHGTAKITLRPIVGTVTDHECDARCTTAKGPNCECACGGSNHGSAHQ